MLTEWDTGRDKLDPPQVSVNWGTNLETNKSADKENIYYFNYHQ